MLNGFYLNENKSFFTTKLRSLPRIEKEAGSKWIWTLTGCDKINANNVTNFVVKWVSDKVVQSNIPDSLLGRDNQTCQQNRRPGHQEYPNIFSPVWVHRTLHLASQEFCKEIKIRVIKKSSSQINHLGIFGGKLELACSRGSWANTPNVLPGALARHARASTAWAPDLWREYEFGELRRDARLDNVKLAVSLSFFVSYFNDFF